MSDDDLIRRGDAAKAITTLAQEFIDGGSPTAANVLNLASDRINAIPASQVTVKPLEWENSLKGRWIGTPPAPLGIMAFWVFHDPSGFWRATSTGKIHYITLEAAKAAAQADYDARIRSALTVTTAPDPAKVQALVALMPEVIASLEATGCNVSLVRDVRAAIAAMKEGK